MNKQSNTNGISLDPKQLKELERRLREKRSAILELEDARSESGAVVELDQTRTGRLSRMDAMQLQAMAKAGEARARVELKRIDAALKRMENGDFGECLDCGEPIAAGRLQADPASTLCVTCAAARED